MLTQTKNLLQKKQQQQQQKSALAMINHRRLEK